MADRKAKSVKATPLVVHLEESLPKHQRLLKKCLAVKKQDLENLKQVHVELTTTTNEENDDTPQPRRRQMACCRRAKWQTSYARLCNSYWYLYHNRPNNSRHPIIHQRHVRSSLTGRMTPKHGTGLRYMEMTQ